MLPKKKVLLVQPSLQPPGGGNAVAVWMIEALKREYEVSVLTWEPVDIDPINDFYGTSFSASDFKVLYSAPRLLRRLYELDPDPFSRQGFCVLVRLCKMMQNRYDVFITGDNECDFGRKGIQYIHYPYFYPTYRKLYPFTDLSGARTPWNATVNRHRPWRLISGFSFERMKANLTLVNSDWTGAKVRDCYGITTTTVHPPAPGDFPLIPWSERENGFVCIGRIAPEKRFDQIIAIVAALRSQGRDFHLHIIGGSWGKLGAREYYQRIRQQVRQHASWATLHENVPRDELVRLVSTHKYGIHRQPDEHFGIAVAEMVRGGCIVFTHRSGGQVEIIGQEERLSFETNDEAIAKIRRVLEDPDEQNALRGYLHSRKDLFSTERFMNEIREVVRDFAP